MAIEQTKISLPLTRFVHTEKRQLLCEGTALLPDARFVGAKILHADAIIRMGSAQITADQLSVEGAVLFNVLYTGGDEPVGSAQAQYAFTHVFEVPDAAPDMRAFAGARVDSVAATLTGARVGLKAVVTLWAEGEAAEQIEAVQSLSDGQAQTLEQTAALCTARTHGLRRMLLEGDDELPLPTTGQVLYFTHRLRVLETQMQDGYARVAGELLLDAYHSGEKPLIKTSHAFPFDLDVPLEHAAADFTVAVQAKVQELAVTVTPADDPQGLGVLHVEGTLVCQAQAEQIQSADLLADAYAVGAQELTLEKKDLPLYAGTTRAQANSTAHLSLDTPQDAPAISAVLAAFASPVHMEAVDEHGAVAGILRAAVLYAAQDETLHAINAELPFEAHFDTDTPPDAALFLTCGDVTASGSGDRAELRAQLLLETRQIHTQNLPVVVDAQTAARQQTDPVHIAVRFARPGDTLWSVAKAHRVDLNTLRKLNPGVSVLAPGDKLILLCGSDSEPANAIQSPPA